MRQRPRASLAVLALGLAAGACSIVPAPQPDPSKFYVLSAIAPGEAQTAAWANTSRLTIGLGPISLPEYLKRREVVTRVAPNRVELSATSYWAEPLDESFQRVLGEDLSTVLGTRQILAYPWYSTTPIDYQVQVDVQRFERDQSGAAELAAIAVIKDAKGRVLVTQQLNLTQAASSGSADASAAALSADLGSLSREIGQMIERLQSTRPASSTSIG
jgi:uncharacterized protein